MHSVRVSVSLTVSRLTRANLIIVYIVTVNFVNTLNPTEPTNEISLLSTIEWDQWSSSADAPPLLTLVDSTPNMTITADTYRQSPMALLTDISLSLLGLWGGFILVCYYSVFRLLENSQWLLQFSLYLMLRKAINRVIRFRKKEISWVQNRHPQSYFSISRGNLCLILRSPTPNASSNYPLALENAECMPD